MLDRPTEKTYELAPGVTLAGVYHPGEGYVDIDTIELRGRPDRIAAYLAENNQQADDFETLDLHDTLESYAEILNS